MPGERVCSLTSGGGGYGDPLDRDPSLVLEDVLEGWVSRERALAVYGVAFAGDGAAGLRVDADATEVQRRSLRRSPDDGGS